jgi:hypothetical protein
MLGSSRRARRASFGLVVLLVVGLVAVVFTPTVSARASVTVGTGGEFVSVVGRLVDTRVPTGTTKAPLAPNSPRVIQVNGQAGLPATGVSAVLMTFTATDPVTSGQISAGPADGALGGVMQYDGGSVTSNSGIVSVSVDGTIQVQATTTTNLMIDIQGYYTVGNGITAAGGYSPVQESRIVDTVNGVGLAKATLTGGSTSTIQVTGKANVPAGAAAAFVSLAVDNTNTVSGYLNPYATSATSRPGVSLNFDGSPFTTMGAIVKLDSTGAFKLYLSVGNTINLLVDVEGYFTAGSSNGTFTPAVGNLYDTRVKPHVSVKPMQTVTVPIGGTSGIPSAGDGLSSAVINVTIANTGSHGSGYARAWADGTTEPTNVGTATFNAGSTNLMTTNLATVPVGLDGAIEIHNVSTNTVDYIVDLEGFYQNTSSTLCARDALTVTGDTSVGADQGDPTLSAVLINSLGNSVDGEIYVQDAAGNPIGGRPTATGVVDSGTRLTYHVPASALTAGSTYTWWVHGYMADTCAAQATTVHHTFTMGSVPAYDATPQAGPNTLTLGGASLNTRAAPQGLTCSNLACPLTAGTTKVGSDGTGDWITWFKADLSSIPAGATVNSATLNLATNSCLAGTSCDSTNTVLAPATDDTSSADTGSALAGFEPSSDSNLPVSSTGSVDITSLLNDWYTSGGATNEGAILFTTGSANGSQFTPTITITYTPATVPSPITNLNVISGDGGFLVTWAGPADSGYVDKSGATSGITSYQVVAKNAAAATVASTSTSDTKTVLTGLTNGTAYSITVTALNPVGASGGVVAGNVSPASVGGNASALTQVVTQSLNARDALWAGTAASTQDAVAAVGGGTATTGAVGLVAASTLASYDAMATAGQYESADATTLTNTIVAPSSDGSQYIVFATATESSSLVDSSSGSPVTTATGGTDDIAFIFSSGSNPQLLASASESALAAALTTQDVNTANSPLDPSQLSATSTDAFTLDPTTGQIVDPTTTSAPAMLRAQISGRSHGANLAGVKSWAHANAYSSFNGGFKDDCTDFVSRALQLGGRLPMRDQGPHVARSADDNYWWEHSLYPGRPVSWSNSWSMARNNFIWQQNQGSSFTTRSNLATPGDVIYVAWSGGGQANISHAAIVDAKSGSNLIIDQHTSNRRDSLYKWGGYTTWSAGHPHMQFWIVNPSERY